MNFVGHHEFVWKKWAENAQSTCAKPIKRTYFLSCLNDICVLLTKFSLASNDRAEPETNHLAMRVCVVCYIEFSILFVVKQNGRIW